MQFRAAHENRARGGAGIYPHVEGVIGLRGRFGASPAGGFDQRPQFRGGLLEPDVGAVLFEEVGGVTDDLGVEDRVALRVIKRRDRHAPGTLARDAPVRTRLDGALDAVHAPVGDPLHAPDLGERPVAEFLVINLHEPLVHRAEDGGGLASPAIRVGVVIILLVQQRMANPQLVQHRFVRVALAVFLQNGLANHLRGHLLLARQVVGPRKTAVVIHW